LAALSWASIAAIAPAAFAADPASGVQTQEEIARQLKTRGLPSIGTAPATPRQDSGVTPVNTGPVSPHEAKPHPALPDAAASAAESGRVTFRTITFQFGSAQLRPESIETLRNLGNALNQQLKDEKAFVIEGHTDRTGTRAYNDELSRRRAEAVKDYLVRDLGVSADRLQAVGKGFSEPVNPRQPYAAENRRVVVVNAGNS
jgi:outer membrane protein OmpA-like peptidoglycan-associated protein